MRGRRFVRPLIAGLVALVFLAGLLYCLDQLAGLQD